MYVCYLQITMHFKKINVCLKVLVERFTFFMNNAMRIVLVFSMNNAKMNNVSKIFWWH